MKYVELLVKSNFSFLTGASHPQELVKAAVSQGLAGLALADRDGMYGVVRGFQEARAHSDFQYIVGAQTCFLQVAPQAIPPADVQADLRASPFVDSQNPIRIPLTLLPKNRQAYGALCLWLTQAKAQVGEDGSVDQATSSLSPGRRASPTHAGVTFTDFCNYWGARSGPSRECIVLPDPALFSSAHFSNTQSGALHAMDWGELHNLFPRNVYIPLARYLDGCDRDRTAAARAISQRFALPIVATNDVYYHVKARKRLQDVMIAIREGRPLAHCGRSLFSNGERYLKNSAQMARLFADLPEALERTVAIAAQCEFSLQELRYTYPSEWIPSGLTAQQYLEQLVREWSPKRYPSGVPAAVARQLNHELGIIGELRYADYFLTIFDIVEFARGREILCQGRGSAANSAVCYVLGITAIDPVRMNLLFERFISAERGEPPDIDVDFEHERREEVIQYIYKKFGRHRAGMVSAVVTYQRRSAFREVCKAFGVPVGTLSAKAVERQYNQLMLERSGQSIAEAAALRTQIDECVLELLEFPRHLTIHSGGFTLSAEPIHAIVPIEPARMEGRTIIQWDKYDLDALGLLKIDVLALGMLSALRKTLNAVGLRLHEIPANDPATFAMLQRGDTVGTFQVESRAQMSMLGRLKPQNFYDLVVEVAIVRPGPIVGKMVHPYLKRRRGWEKVEYPNEKVRQILGRTLGVPLFQEQVMKLAIELAGFTPGEADRLRRSINAWRTSAPIAEMADRLKCGLVAGGLSPAFAQQVFDQIQGFSEYGFPESHAASFALLAYASAYLKRHYPAAFACALINSQPMGFYRIDTLVYDAIRHGVRVEPVCIDQSLWDCVVEPDGALRLGFRVVHGLAKRDAESLIVARNERPFVNLEDLCRRTGLRRDVLERLAMAGRFYRFHLGERAALWALLEYQNYFRAERAHGPAEQMTLAEWALRTEAGANEASSAGVARPEALQGNLFRSLDAGARIQMDYEAFQLSTHGHPMTILRREAPGLSQAVRAVTSKGLRSRAIRGASIEIAGMVLIRQRPPTARGVAFATLEDEDGFIDLIFHAPIFARYKELLSHHCFIVIRGRVQRDGHTVSVLVQTAREIHHVSEATALANGLGKPSDASLRPFSVGDSHCFYDAHDPKRVDMASV